MNPSLIVDVADVVAEWLYLQRFLETCGARPDFWGAPGVEGPRMGVGS